MAARLRFPTARFLRRASSIAVGAALLAGGPAHGQFFADVPRRVVSIDLCADQLLLTLADPSQVAALSMRSGDPTQSALADVPAIYPHVADSAEAVLGFAPDLILAGTFTNDTTVERLRRLGLNVVQLGPIATIDEAIAQIQTVADLLGQQRTGALIGDLIASARVQSSRPDFGVTAAYLDPGGALAGSADLITDLLGVIGIHNIGAELVPPNGGHVALELLVAAQPDYLVVADADAPTDSQGAALLEHTALVALYPPARRIEVPETLTLCGGPSLPDAIAELAREYRRVNPASSGP